MHPPSKDQKLPSWTGSAGEGSSLTDSQFLFGSQLWPDPSQKLSQDITFPSRISQQASPQMKITLNSIDKNIESAKGAILQCLEAFTKTMQDNVASMQDNMATQLKVLLHKLDCEGEILMEIKDRNAKMDLEMSAFQSCVQGLSQDLQDLRTEQSKELGMMGDALSLLQGFTSSQKLTARMADKKVQTSLCLLERSCLAGEEVKHLESLEVRSGLVQFGGDEGKGGESECPSDVEPSVQHCSVNLSMAGIGEDSRQRSCSIRSSARCPSVYVNNPARTLRKNSAPNGGKLPKCPPGLSGQSQGAGQQSVYTAGKSVKKPSRCRPALRKRARVESAQKSRLDWSGDSCGDGHDGSSILKDLTGYVKATPSFSTSSVWQQSLWQLFNIVDDSD